MCAGNQIIGPKIFLWPLKTPQILSAQWHYRDHELPMRVAKFPVHVYARPRTKPIINNDGNPEGPKWLMANMRELTMIAKGHLM
jgi:hypothetical protein